LKFLQTNKETKIKNKTERRRGGRKKKKGQEMRRNEKK
jgi:hypothetical protein